MESLFNNVLSQRVEPDDLLVESPELINLGKTMKHCMNEISNTSRTAKLWIGCLDYINIIKEFIYCKRLGLWDGYLSAVTKLLNLFAATGNIHYVRSARLYVQKMHMMACDECRGQSCNNNTTGLNVDAEYETDDVDI